MSSHQSPLDEWKAQILSLRGTGLSNSQIALELAKLGQPTSEKSIRRAVKRWRTEGEASFAVKGDEAEITSKPSLDLADTNQLLRDRGLDPDDWIVQNLIVNEWDSPTGETLKQLKVHLRRKQALDLIAPARLPGPTFIRPKARKSSDTPKLAILVSDHHAPHHDPYLHACILEFLADQKPDEGYLLGDLIDASEVSRHRHDPAWKATTQACLNAGYRILLDYLEASPSTAWTFIVGNHEQRLRNALIDNVRDLYGLTPGSVPGEELLPAMSLQHLLRLDELGIKFIGDEQVYEHTKVKISGNLAGVHGSIAAKGSGTSARRTLEHFRHSVAQGHSHRMSEVFHTVYDINGKPETLTGAEIGCCCKLQGGLGYAVQPDWQNGFCTAVLRSDQTFKLESAVFVDNALLWRDKRYS